MTHAKWKFQVGMKKGPTGDMGPDSWPVSGLCRGTQQTGGGEALGHASPASSPRATVRPDGLRTGPGPRPPAQAQNLPATRAWRDAKKLLWKALRPPGPACLCRQPGWGGLTASQNSDFFFHAPQRESKAAEREKTGFCYDFRRFHPLTITEETNKREFHD